MRRKRRRIVAVGDLNGAYSALQEILRGTGLVTAKGRWAGGSSRLIQLGDIFNRGDSARQCIEMLQRLRREAQEAGGEVHVVLGNHEVLMATGLEAFSTIGEYLSFASSREREAWPKRQERASRRLCYARGSEGVAEAFPPRFGAWQLENVPGKVKMRRALGPHGRIGRWIRTLPIAVRLESMIFVHAGLLPAWARRGLDGLDEMARREWERFDSGVPLRRSGILRAGDGPLWNRSLSKGKGREALSALRESLSVLGSRRMIVGHTPTVRVPHGIRGEIAVRFDGRLVCLDVGISEAEKAPKRALIVDGDRGISWSPSSERILWDDA